MTSINNDLKKILRDKFNIQNITTSRIKAGYQSTDDYYHHLYELYNKEKEIELEQLIQKEKLENELKEKIDKLKQKNKLKKLKYKLNRKKKLNYEQNDDDNTTLNDQVINSVNDLDDGKNNVQCNDIDNDENDVQCNDLNNSTDDISSDENENNCIETYNDTTIEVKNDLYIYFSNELIKNNNNIYLLYLIELLKNFYKNNSNYKKFINESNYIKLEIVKDIHSYNNEHFNGIFYDTMKRKSPQIHFYVKNDQITKMSYVIFI